jgi:hypothetical protein
MDLKAFSSSPWGHLHSFAGCFEFDSLVVKPKTEGQPKNAPCSYIVVEPFG